MNFNTALLHQSFDGEKATGSTLVPVYQSSAFAHESAEKLEAVFNNKAPGFAYTRISNPTVDSFEKRVAAMEKGIGAVACSSGMAAVTMSLLNILESGDEIIAGSALFGGTIDLFGDLEAFGIKTVFTDEVTAESVEKLATDRTKAVFTELIGNPKLNVTDIKAVSEAAHKRGIPLIIDSTTATPYLINPFDFGADIVVHSSSKYINGSGNSISGVIIDSGNFKWDTKRYRGFEEYKKFGKFAYLAKLRNGIWRNVGACLAPMNAYLNSIGLETLGLRMERLCFNAKRLAEFFEEDGRVSVNYPALESNPYHELTVKQLKGMGGAIITIRAGSKEKAFKLINSLKYACIATNIGDVRTLVIHPASTIYTHSTTEQQVNAGVYDDSIRISVGIEDIEDLIADFRQAIDKTEVI
ncbi:MAG: aminotransferase class V-fold PLP-dependent enzyme [Oscillospiraceae bacterium]|nr:aminotransferase class V-fold PLP-dependent enzyme [Oscillospiraceae bacterium]MDY6208604.1 aminotransferase class V-fold PLP-dependent enzyme [Oscillospiraceae bacterium]